MTPVTSGLEGGFDGARSPSSVLTQTQTSLCLPHCRWAFSLCEAGYHVAGRPLWPGARGWYLPMAGCHEGAPQCGSTDRHHSNLKTPEGQRETLLGLVFVT